MSDPHFHVFLVHHEDDQQIAENLAHRLKSKNINPWIYSWQLIPGETRQEGIEKGLSQCDTCAILIGRNGIEEWQKEEMRVALDRQAKEGVTGFRVIPVILPQ